MKSKKPSFLLTTIFLGVLLIASLLYNVVLFQKTNSFESPSVSNPSGAIAEKKLIDGKVWIQLRDNPFDAYFVTDKTCKVCVSLDDMENAFEQTFPTANVKKVDVSSEKGKEILQAGLTVVPAIVLDASFKNISQYSQLLKSGNVTPIGKSDFVEFRTNGNKKILSADQIPASPEDATVAIVGYTDVFSPDAATFSTILSPLAIKYGKGVVMKNNLMAPDLPSMYIAQALQCGVTPEEITEAQPKYAKALTTILSDTKGKQGDIIAKDIANALEKELQLSDKEKECYEAGAFVDTLTASTTEAQKFGVTGAPAYFVGNRFLAGKQTADVFAAAIEEVFAEKGMQLPKIPADAASATDSMKAPVDQVPAPEATKK